MKNQFIERGKPIYRFLLILLFIVAFNDTYAQEATIQVDVVVNQGDGCPPVASVEDNQILKVFPNPSSSLIHLQADYEYADVVLMDSKGSIVKKGTILQGKSSFDISQLKRGVYFIKLSHYKHVETIKVVIQ